MNCDNQCCENNGHCHDHHELAGDWYGINVTALARHPEPLVVEEAAELVPEEMRKPGTKITFWTFDGWQTWQFQPMDIREWVLPESWVQDTEELKDMQNQIDSIQIGGWAISNQLGDDPHIGISQKALTELIGFDHVPDTIRGRIQVVEDEIGVVAHHIAVGVGGIGVFRVGDAVLAPEEVALLVYLVDGRTEVVDDVLIVRHEGLFGTAVGHRHNGGTVGGHLKAVFRPPGGGDVVVHLDGLTELGHTVLVEQLEVGAHGPAPYTVHFLEAR